MTSWWLTQMLLAAALVIVALLSAAAVIWLTSGRRWRLSALWSLLLAVVLFLLLFPIAYGVLGLGPPTYDAFVRLVEIQFPVSLFLEDSNRAEIVARNLLFIAVWSSIGLGGLWLGLGLGRRTRWYLRGLLLMALAAPLLVSPGDPPAVFLAVPVVLIGALAAVMVRPSLDSERNRDASPDGVCGVVRRWRFSLVDLFGLFVVLAVPLAAWGRVGSSPESSMSKTDVIALFLLMSAVPVAAAWSLTAVRFLWARVVAVALAIWCASWVVGETHRAWFISNETMLEFPSRCVWIGSVSGIWLWLFDKSKDASLRSVSHALSEVHPAHAVRRLTRIAARAALAALSLAIFGLSAWLYVRLLVPDSIEVASPPTPNAYDQLCELSEELEQVNFQSLKSTPESMRRFCTEHAGLLAQAHDLVRQPSLMPIDYTNTIWNRQEALRPIAFSLDAEAELARLEDRPRDGARAGLALIYLGQIGSRGGTYTDHFSGIAYERMGIDSVAGVVDQLDMTECRDLTAALAEIDANREPSEVAWQRNNVLWQHAFGWEGRYVAACDQLAVWFARNRILIVDVQRRESARCRLLIVELGSQAFRHEHGRWPASLDELVPQYLDAVPLDPFTDRPIIYRIEPDQRLLYSVGPDRIDNGGTPRMNRGFYDGWDVLLVEPRVASGSPPASSGSVPSGSH